VQNATKIGAKLIGNPLASDSKDNWPIASAFRMLNSGFFGLSSIFKDHSLYASVCGYEEIKR
jgi:hypothetical protein